VGAGASSNPPRKKAQKANHFDSTTHSKFIDVQ
jgi:hypothetical protein